MQTRPVDQVFRALADEQRRLVIRYLTAADDGVVSYREVADYVSSHSGKPPGAVLTSLRHSTLPMLAQAGLVRYDDERERIEYSPEGVATDVLDAVESV